VLAWPDRPSQRLAGISPLRTDLIGVTSVWGTTAALAGADLQQASQDVRLRMAWQHADHAAALRLPREVNALYCCGPAGGGVRTHMRQRLGLTSCYIAQEHIRTGFTWAGRL
jgi:hypothetical protein